MSVNGPSTYPTRNLSNIVLHHTPVETADWQAVAQKQNHNYRYTRCWVLNENWEEAPLTTSSTTEDSARYTIPGYNNNVSPASTYLFTADDFDATCSWVVRAVMDVAGVGNGTVRIKVGRTPTNVDLTLAAVATTQVVTVTQALSKNLLQNEISVHLLVSVGTATVTCYGVSIYTEEQVNIE